MIIIWFSSKKVPKLTTREKLFLGGALFWHLILAFLFLLYKLIRSEHRSCFSATAYLELLISPHIPQQRFCFGYEKGSSDENLFEKVKLRKAILSVKLNDSHLTVNLKFCLIPQRVGCTTFIQTWLYFKCCIFSAKKNSSSSCRPPPFA